MDTKHRLILPFHILGAPAITAGCVDTRQLMPTPNLYVQANADPFSDVPTELRSNHVQVLYLTDREREKDTSTGAAYGFKRSRSVAFGISEVQFGKDISWGELVASSQSSARSANLALGMDSVCVK